MKWSRFSIHVAAVVGGEISRQRMLRTGVTFGGERIWSEDEIATLIRCLGTMTYKEMTSHLPGRTVSALATKARKLRIVKGRMMWSDSDITKLRRLYQRGTLDDLKEAFPGRNAKAIQRAALSRGFFRPPRRYKVTGLHLVDSVLERAFDLGYDLFDLDELCQSGRYFRHHTWRRGAAYHGPLLRAVKELGGHIEVVWDDDQYD